MYSFKLRTDLNIQGPLFVIQLNYVHPDLAWISKELRSVYKQLGTTQIKHVNQTNSIMNNTLYGLSIETKIHITFHVSF